MAQTNSNVCSVMIVLALIFTSMMALMFFRTCGRMCVRRTKEAPLTNN